VRRDAEPALQGLGEDELPDTFTCYACETLAVVGAAPAAAATGAATATGAAAAAAAGAPAAATGAPAAAAPPPLADLGAVPA
jgi:hypothetical protein